MVDETVGPTVVPRITPVAGRKEEDCSTAMVTLGMKIEKKN